MAICGIISQYNNVAHTPGPCNMTMIIGKELNLQGFIVSYHGDIRAQFFQDMTAWLGSKKIRFEETVMKGIQSTPDAFVGLFHGKNKGKMLIDLT